MRKVPKRFEEFTNRHPEIATAYEALAGACRRYGPLNARDLALAKIGIAVGAQIENAVRSQVRKALDARLRPEEIRHAIVLAVPSIGFPRTMAALTWADDVFEQENPK